MTPRVGVLCLETVACCMFLYAVSVPVPGCVAETPVLVPLFSWQIAHGAVRDRTPASAVKGRQGALAIPSSTYKSWFDSRQGQVISLLSKASYPASYSVRTVGTHVKVAKACSLPLASLCCPVWCWWNFSTSSKISLHDLQSAAKLARVCVCVARQPKPGLGHLVLRFLYHTITHARTDIHRHPVGLDTSKSKLRLRRN